jgi:hypothetical protein
MRISNVCFRGKADTCGIRGDIYNAMNLYRVLRTKGPPGWVYGHDIEQVKIGSLLDCMAKSLATNTDFGCMQIDLHSEEEAAAV